MKSMFDYLEDERREAAESLDSLFPSYVEVSCKECGCEFSIMETELEDKRLCKKCLNPWDYMHDPGELERLVWEMPTTKVAELFGVSDVAVGKRCKKHGIKKPPRGYWAKINAGYLPALMLERNL